MTLGILILLLVLGALFLLVVEDLIRLHARLRREQLRYERQDELERENVVSLADALRERAAR